MALTVKRIAALREKGRYLDEHGLYLQVGKSPTAKAWLFRYERNGAKRWMGLGALHTYSLDEARDLARDARQLLKAGVDPLEQRKAAADKQRQAERDNIDFRTAADDFLRLHGPTWKNAKHRKQWETTLQQHAYAKLGARPVKVIDAALINETLAPMWNRTPETASRLRQRIERVVQWVKAGKPLPLASNGIAPKGHAALPWQQVPPFMAALAKRESVAARALEFLILTAARSGEVTGATWAEIDIDAKRWTVPAERMKAGKEHRVPLGARAISLLAELPREGDYVFIGTKAGKPISKMALPTVLQQVGRPDITVHGFRSAFKDWASEATSHPNMVSEMALAHTIGSKVEAAYRRGDLFTKRAKLMTDWAAFCYRPVADVVPIGAPSEASRTG